MVESNGARHVNPVLARDAEAASRDRALPNSSVGFKKSET
jgi:hypothetical protein